MLHFRIDPAGSKVLGLWLFLPGAVISPFCFGRPFGAGPLFGCMEPSCALVGSSARTHTGGQCFPG